MKDVIFIVGLHRSGSTLWHNLISICPGVMRLTDPRFLGERRHKDFGYFLKTGAGDLSIDQNVDRMVEICFSKKNLPGLDSTFWKFKDIDLADDPELKRAIADRIKRSDRSLGAIARAFIEEITRFGGCTRACVKFPVDVGHVRELVAWFPDCKVVHITRDPRAMAMSKTNDPSGTALKILDHPRLAWLIKKAAVWFVIAQYRWTARLHLKYRGLPNYRLFRYEDLLFDPERTLRELCSFVEIPFSAAMLDPQGGRHEHQPSSLTGTRRKGFDPAAATRWREVISPFDNGIISALTKNSMKALGYDPATHPIFQKHRSSETKIEPASVS